MTRVAGPVRSIQLKNFRRFEDTGCLQLAPVTLMLGKNSSGKTSLLRSLLLMKQFVSAPTFEDVPLAGPHVDYGPYKALVYDGELSRDVEISVEVVIDADRRRRYPASRVIPAVESLLEEGFRLDVALHWNKQQGRAQYSRIRFCGLGDPSVWVSFARRGPATFAVETSSRKVTVNSPLNFSTLGRLPVVDLFAARGRGPQGRAAPDYTVFALMDALYVAVDGLKYVGPLRDMPDRAYRIDQLSPESPTASVVNVLERQKQAQTLMSNALREMGMARDVSLAPLAPGYVGIVLTDPATGRVDNLSDVGFGVSQVLPVIAALATGTAGSTLMIEQPELHLHPESQGQLADVLLTMSAERKCGLVVETHSEHILLRVMRRVADQSVSAEDVCILIVDNGRVRRLGLDSRGRLINGSLPDGFFEEDWQDSVLLAKAAAEQRISG